MQENTKTPAKLPQMYENTGVEKIECILEF